MKKLVKSTLLALGILPFGLFADDAPSPEKNQQRYQIQSQVIFHSPKIKVHSNKDPFEPFGAKQLGAAFDVNLDFYFYNITTESEVEQLSKTNGIAATEFYKVPVKPTTVPLRPGVNGVNIVTPPNKTTSKKSVTVKPITTSSASAVTPTPPLSVQQPMIEIDQPDSVFAQSRVIFEAQQGQYTGGKIDAFAPFYGTPDNFFFANLIGSVYGSVYQTYSAGLGHREVIGDAIYGFYGYYDRQKSQANFYYNRISGGVERLGMTWDMRANFYFYPNTPHNTQDLGQKSAFIKADTNDIYYNHFYSVKKASSGADVEVGRTLGLDNLRGYVGAYSFGQNINGGRARITYNISPNWQINGMGQYDGERGWLAMGGISYTLGRFAVTNTIIDRIHEPVVRDMTVAEATIHNYQTVDLDTRKIYFANPTGNNAATGTQNNPMDLATALSTAKAGDLIYLEGGDYNLSSAINLKANQIFWGTGADLYTQGATGFLLLPKSGTVSNLKADNIAQNQTPSNCLSYICAVYANQTASYGGFDLTNTTPNTTTNNFVGILIGNAEGITFKNVNVSGFTTNDYTGYGIRIDDGGTGNANPVFTNITSNNNNVGLSIVSSGDVNIRGETNTFNNNLGSDSSNGVGLYVNGFLPINLTIKNAEFNGNNIGLRLNNAGSPMAVNLSNLQASNNVDAGIWISQNANVSGSHVTASGNGLTNTKSTYNYGIYMDGGILNGDYFTLSGNTSAQLFVTGDANTVVRLDHSSLIANSSTAAQGQELALWLAEDSSIYIKNAINVVGTATNTTGHLEINGLDLSFKGALYKTWNCTIKFGAGTCTPA